VNRVDEINKYSNQLKNLLLMKIIKMLLKIIKCY